MLRLRLLLLFAIMTMGLWWSIMRSWTLKSAVWMSLEEVVGATKGRLDFLSCFSYCVYCCCSELLVSKGIVYSSAERSCASFSSIGFFIDSIMAVGGSMVECERALLFKIFRYVLRIELGSIFGSVSFL